MRSLKKDVILATYIIMLTLALMNLDQLSLQIGYLFSISKPIIYGFVTAYLLNFLLRGVEKYPLRFMDKGSKIAHQLKRPFAVCLTYFIAGACFYFLLAVTLPELAASFNLLVSKSPELISNTTKQVTAFFQDLQLDKFNPAMWSELTKAFSSYSTQLVQMITEGSGRLLQLITEGLPRLLSATTNVAGVMFDFTIGLIISVYLLIGREQLQNQLSKIVIVVFNEKWSGIFHEVAVLITQSFNNYVYGKLLDSVLVFCLTYFGMLLLQLPYAALISVIVTITNLVPYIGPLVGGFLSFFLICVIDFRQAILFVILDVVVQQVEGNIIGPQIFGKSLGLPGLWVMISVFIGGGFFGMVGMVLAPPIMTVIYVLVSRYINGRFQDRQTVVLEVANQTSLTSKPLDQEDIAET